MGDKHGYMTSLDQYDAVMNVYDAAMAEHRALLDYRRALNAHECGAAKYSEEEIDKLDTAHREAQDKLEAACRAAEADFPPAWDEDKQWVYDAAMAARQSGALVVAIRYLGEHSLHDASEYLATNAAMVLSDALGDRSSTARLWPLLMLW